MSADLIMACIRDGVLNTEFEMTDENECIDREVRTKMYRDADGNAIPGYYDFTEVESTRLMSPDECCENACEEEANYFLLPACPDRRVTAGEAAYSIDIDDEGCQSTQTDTIAYFLTDGTEECSFMTTYTKSTSNLDAGISKMHCCAEATS